MRDLPHGREVCELSISEEDQMPETVESLMAKLGLETEDDIRRFFSRLTGDHPEVSLESAFRTACADKEIVLVDSDGALFRALCGYRPAVPCAVGH